MRIMIDTNVILSAVYKRNSLPDRVLQFACEYHDLLLCDHIVEECYDVVRRRFPSHITMLDDLFANLSYELVPAPRTSAYVMSDPKDQPILNAALLHEIDVLISGDKHFLTLNMDRPKMMSPAQFGEWMQLI